MTARFRLVNDSNLPRIIMIPISKLFIIEVYSMSDKPNTNNWWIPIIVYWSSLCHDISNSWWVIFHNITMSYSETNCSGSSKLTTSNWSDTTSLQLIIMPYWMATSDVFSTNKEIQLINGHFRNFNWRYLPYIRLIWYFAVPPFNRILKISHWQLTFSRSCDKGHVGPGPHWKPGEITHKIRDFMGLWPKEWMGRLGMWWGGCFDDIFSWE